MTLCSKVAARPKETVPVTMQLVPWLWSGTCESSAGALCASGSCRSDRSPGSILRCHFSNISTSIWSRSLVWLRGRRVGLSPWLS